MRILWISYIFPPYGGKEGQQGAFQLREIVRRGVEVDVLTIRACREFPNTDSSLVGVIPKCVAIHRTSAGLLSAFRYHQRPASALRTRISDFTALLNNIEWVPIAWRKLRCLQGPYDGIYSLGDPISCHVVAALAKRRFGSRLMLDYGDPYALKPARCNVSWIRLVAQRTLEAWCLRQADVIGMRVDSNADAYKKVFPFLVNTPFVTMYGGVDQEAFDGGSVERPPTFRLLYTGKVYDHTIGVRACLQAVSSLRSRGYKVNLCFLGTAREDVIRHAPCELTDICEFLPYQSATDTMQFQKQASVLLAFGFNYPYAIPSKIAEYLAARRPIVCVERAPNVISELVRKYERGLSAFPDPVDIASKLEQLYNGWVEGTLDKTFRLANPIPEISWSAIVDTILSSLRRDSTSRKGGIHARAHLG